MCRCRAHRAHFIQLDRHSTPRTLPRRFASGEPSADYLYLCHKGIFHPRDPGATENANNLEFVLSLCSFRDKKFYLLSATLFSASASKVTTLRSVRNVARPIFRRTQSLGGSNRAPPRTGQSSLLP